MPDQHQMPVIFVAHGSPMNAIEDSVYAKAWRAFGEQIARPRAILMISAHWYIRGLAVTAMQNPPTIHDFWGFPPELFAIEYGAPGSPELAHEVKDLLMGETVELDSSWGLDHGAWSVLVHMFPEADVPVVQLSIDATRSASYHYEIGKQLAKLRHEGVLIIGSGNIVHNLNLARFDLTEPYTFTVAYDTYVRNALNTGDNQALIGYETHPDALVANPTPDHYLPLLYVVGAKQDQESPEVVTDGFLAGSLSMLGVRFG